MCPDFDSQGFCSVSSQHIEMTRTARSTALGVDEIAAVLIQGSEWWAAKFVLTCFGRTIWPAFAWWIYDLVLIKSFPRAFLAEYDLRTTCFWDIIREFVSAVDLCLFFCRLTRTHFAWDEVLYYENTSNLQEISTGEEVLSKFTLLSRGGSVLQASCCFLSLIRTPEYMEWFGIHKKKLTRSFLRGPGARRHSWHEACWFCDGDDYTAILRVPRPGLLRRQRFGTHTSCF